MSRSSPTTRAYKEVTLQQLRSFSETARLGSLTAAAASLDLAQPTVWKQVHALEREFGTPLIEPFGRGCRLTKAGRLLAELAGPAVTHIATLKRRFQEAQAAVVEELNVVTTPRILIDDLPECVVAFARRWPNVRLSLCGFKDVEVAGIIETGKADLGLTTDRGPDPHNPWLQFELAYELEVILITPRDHPLARRRRIRPEDLQQYPFVNTPGAFRNPSITVALDRLGVFDNQDRRVETYYAAAVRRYVRMGFGIGLIGALPGRPPEPGFHERPMSSYFGRLPVYFVWRKGALQSDALRCLVDTIRDMRKPVPSRR